MYKLRRYRYGSREDVKERGWVKRRGGGYVQMNQEKPSIVGRITYSLIQYPTVEMPTIRERERREGGDKEGQGE